MTDLTSDSTKARSYRSFLQSGRALQAVVQSVVSGSRFRVYVPSENCLLSFALAGVKAPRSARPAVVAAGARGARARGAARWGS